METDFITSLNNLRNLGFLRYVSIGFMYHKSEKEKARQVEIIQKNNYCVCDFSVKSYYDFTEDEDTNLRTDKNKKALFFETKKERIIPKNQKNNTRHCFKHFHQ